MGDSAEHVSCYNSIVLTDAAGMCVKEQSSAVL